MTPARATACSNIALVKYWGKRPPSEASPELNLPAVGSLSMTLAGLTTETTVREAATDLFELDGGHASASAVRRCFAHLDRVWDLANAGARPPCHVSSRNSFPTAAGLASSASGFAALTLAAAKAFGVADNRQSLSSVARMGSGSAARSLWGGFVRLDRGQASDGSDCVARQLYPPEHFDVRLLVVQTAAGPKAVGSTEGMERCRETSPFYPAWVDTSEADLDAAQTALADRDLDALGQVMEHSCFKMHGAMMGSRPALLYWNGTTIEVIRRVWEARRDGLVGYVTSDAGPHVKVLCRAQTADELAGVLGGVQGVLDVAAARPGPDAVVEVLRDE